MNVPQVDRPQRVLIASSHALFGLGLNSLLRNRRKTGAEVVGMVSNLQEAMIAIDELRPDLVIVDYDDQMLNRDEFLARFVEGERKLRVVLLSLQQGEEALVYDRRSLRASQIDEWLEDWTVDRQSQAGSEALSASLPSSAGQRRNRMKHWIAVALLILVITALLLLGLQNVQLLPVQASEQAKPIDSLFKIEFQVIAFLFALIVGFMIYSIVVFRRRKGDTSDGPHVEGNTRLEVVWTVAPLITVLAFAYMGGQSLSDTLRADPQPVEVDVIGSQWSWRFDYSETGISSNELVLPVNKQTLLYLSSLDVIHSFWVPEFRVKQDALPGGESFVRQLRITPNLIGEYKVRCAELCGLKHAFMEAPVKIVSQEEYDAWVETQLNSLTDPVARGKRWSTVYGCVACHSVDGKTGLGPTWKGIYGHTVQLTDGTSATVDDAYILNSIRNPGAQLLTGFTNIMPADIGKDLTDEQIQDLIEYIKTLK